MKIYLGGDLRVEAIRNYLELIDSLVVQKEHSSFLPHRDVPIPHRNGREKGLLRKKEYQEFGKFVFNEDLQALQECDAAIFVLEGLCWSTTLDLGYTYAFKQLINPQLKIIGLFTDPKKEEGLDIMRLHACDIIINTVSELNNVLGELLMG